MVVLYPVLAAIRISKLSYIYFSFYIPTQVLTYNNGKHGLKHLSNLIIKHKHFFNKCNDKGLSTYMYIHKTFKKEINVFFWPFPTQHANDSHSDQSLHPNRI